MLLRDVVEAVPYAGTAPGVMGLVESAVPARGVQIMDLDGFYKKTSQSDASRYTVGVQRKGGDLYWHALEESEGPMPMDVLPVGTFFAKDAEAAIEIARKRKTRKPVEGHFGFFKGLSKRDDAMADFGQRMVFESE